MTRVAVVIIEEGQLALIERTRDGRRYYLFPGGTVEIGETPQAAAIREAREELGLDVVLVQLAARGAFGGNEQLYYVARATGGRFGSGGGAEMSGLDVAGHGSYRAVRVPLDELAGIDVRPRDLAGLASASERSGWPADPHEVAG